MSDNESEFEQVGLSDLESGDEEMVVVQLPRSFETNTAESASQQQSATSSLSFVRGVGNINLSSDTNESWSEICSTRSSSQTHFRESFIPNGASSVASSGSSMISGFDLLSLSGTIKRRCKRCSFHNGENDGVCLLCGCALVANPCLDMDEQIARHLQQKEEHDARQALLVQEKKRALVTQQTVLERSQTLANEVCVFVRENFEPHEVSVVPEANLSILASRFMDCLDTAIAFDDGTYVSVAYHFSQHQRGRMDEVRRDGLGDGARISEDIEVAFRYQGCGEIPLVHPSLPPIHEDATDSVSWGPTVSIHEDATDSVSWGPTVSGWIVATLDGPHVQGIKEQAVERGTWTHDVVTILDRSELALPLIHFVGYRRNGDVIGRAFRGLAQVCSDFFQQEEWRLDQADIEAIIKANTLSNKKIRLSSEEAESHTGIE